MLDPLTSGRVPLLCLVTIGRLSFQWGRLNTAIAAACSHQRFILGSFSSSKEITLLVNSIWAQDHKLR